MKALIPISLMALSCSALAGVYPLLNTKAQNDVTVEENGSNVIVTFHISQLETENSKNFSFQNFENLVELLHVVRITWQWYHCIAMLRLVSFTKFRAHRIYSFCFLTDIPKLFSVSDPPVIE